MWPNTSKGPQDSLTNRNKLIAECSDSPAQGVHELTRPSQRWDDERKEKEVHPDPQTPTWRRVLLEPAPRPMGAAVVVVWRREALRDLSKRKHVEACMHAGENKGTNRSRWCGG